MIRRIVVVPRGWQPPSVARWMILALAMMPAVVSAASVPDSPSAPESKSIELIRDGHFQRGFQVMAPPMGKKVVEAVIPGIEPGAGEAVWQLDQWNSRFSLATAKRLSLPSGEFRYANSAKEVIVGKPGTDQADLTLRIDSPIEYDGKFRVSGQPWPHLLVEQAIESSPNLDETSKVIVHIEARLVDGKRTTGPGYSRDLHCGQVPFVLTIQNCNRDSKGFGDFLWFIVPLYDDRDRIVPPYVAADFADPSAKLIFNPGGAAYTAESLHDGRWVTIDKDLRPLILDALAAGWDKGYLKDSRDIRDYRISTTNLGWEAPGLFAGAIQIRNLSLKAVLRENP
jgi:hypothetical protein